METKSDKTTFFRLIISKSGAKIWMNIDNKPTSSKTICPIYVKQLMTLFNCSLLQGEYASLFKMEM